MEQKNYFGVGATCNLKNFCNKNVRNIFLVTGKKSYETCGAKAYIDKILQDFNVIRFYNFEENPKLKDVMKGISLFKNNKIDLVVASGGGSAIDMAKLINIFAFQQYNPKDYIYKEREIRKKGKPLIAIPTTSGTGSEATHFAVVYIGKTKYSVAHKYLLPDAAIIDPQFTFNLPKKIAASTGMDALSHAIESYWCINSNKKSKEYAKRAIKLIMENLPSSVNISDRHARIKMSEAANLAGKAINITKTTACHAISYLITSYFGVSHGYAAILTLPEFLIYNYEVSEGDVVDKRGVKYVKKTFNELNVILGCDNIYKSKIKLLNLIKEMGLSCKLSTVGIKSDLDANLIANNANIERLNNNPRMLNKEIIKKILIKII